MISATLQSVSQFVILLAHCFTVQHCPNTPATVSLVLHTRSRTSIPCHPMPSSVRAPFRKLQSQDLNTLIDAAEALESAASGGTNGSVKSPASPPTVDPFYLLTFFHRQTPRPQTRGSSNNNADPEEANSDSNDSQLMELRAELRFPPALSQDPSGSLRGQLRRQLDGLLKRVAAADEPADPEGRSGGGGAKRRDEERDDEWERLVMEEGVRVREGETAEDFYGGAYGGGGAGGRGRRRGAPPRDGIRTERWVDEVGILSGSDACVRRSSAGPGSVFGRS